MLNLIITIYIVYNEDLILGVIMGYTHYFPQKQSVSQSSWKDLCKDLKVLFKEMQSKGVLLESNDPSGKMLDEHKGYINFNGKDDDSHETFYITKSKDSNFNFCKTAAKPYDLAVTATLLLLHHHAPENFEISSDGRPEDWTQAMQLNSKLFGYAFKLPEKIRKKNEQMTQEIENELSSKSFVKKLNPHRFKDMG